MNQISDIFGLLATISSIAVILVGLISQIKQNHRLRSTSGLANNLTYTVLICYVLWAIRGWTKPDIYLIVSQTFGVVASAVIFGQMIYYRRKH